MPPPPSSVKAQSATKNTAAGKKAALNGAAADAAAAGTEKATGTATTAGVTGGSLSKPDQTKYNAEQEDLNKEIAAVKAKLVSIYLFTLTYLSSESLPQTSTVFLHSLFFSLYTEP